ncbi:YgiQ family radical SAM protein [Candidatus Woesearchaeota archaeon]|nr:YgiQ family radical SAM protein [Candidatus Woesearchaeota archaeon]
MTSSFLPTTRDEGKKYYKDFKQFDVIFVTGDPYYDHPLSGTAIIARLLDKKGYKVAIIPQPQTEAEYQSCGRPKYFFCITSGLLDSMLANYTPMLKKRENVLVPERGLMVYTQNLKNLFKGCITIIGGVEATIRRFTHFDYKENILRRGILNDTKADILLFGTAERAILTLLDRMKARNTTEQMPFEEVKPLLDLKTIEGLAYRVKKDEINEKARKLPSYEDCIADKTKFNLLTRVHYLLPDESFVEQCGAGFIQHNRPEHTMIEKEMDVIYSLPFTRRLHPESKNFAEQNGMVERLQTSVIIGRGCWGSCSFCVIPLVQGKEVAKRSKESIIKEIESLYKQGHKKINDLTLPTLNMYGSKCALYTHPEQIFSPVINEPITVYNKKDYCNQQCAGCKYRVISDDLYPLLEEVEKLNKKYSGTELELRSAIRHDIILDQKKLFRKIMQFTGRLKIAPEHISNTVLKQMNKATKQAFIDFLEEYKKVNKEQGTNKNLVPYIVAAHPGSTEKDMQEMRKFCEDNKIYVNLTQIFTPTPGTLSTAMYYTAENPMTREKIHVPRTFREKKNQKNIIMGMQSPDEIADENG